MIRLFLNGLAASAGGGLTYLRNVIPHLARRAEVHVTVAVSSALRSELDDISNVSFLEVAEPGGVGRRFLAEQAKLPALVRKSGAQVLISTGNFALWASPIPQILLSRNALYTSADFLRDVKTRRDYGIWADTFLKGWMARLSIQRADATVAPSEAFAQELREWTGVQVCSIHHGFDHDAFTRNTLPLPEDMRRKMEAEDGLRLLFVSHYNYYRNFETLFRALPILSERSRRRLRLFLTCELKSAENPGSYRAEAAASLVRELRSREMIVELGTVPYGQLHQLYRACHIYVTPAYAESFAHPLVEAMSTGLPIVASDLPVHREIGQDAAKYFPRFSPESLAERVLEIAQSPQLAERLSRNGLKRAQDFSWEKHVDLLLRLAQRLVDAKGRHFTAA